MVVSTFLYFTILNYFLTVPTGHKTASLHDVVTLTSSALRPFLFPSFSPPLPTVSFTLDSLSGEGKEGGENLSRQI